MCQKISDAPQRGPLITFTLVSIQQCMPRSTHLENCLAEKDLEVLVDPKFKMSQQCLLPLKVGSWAAVRSSVARRSEERWLFPSAQCCWGHSWVAVPSAGFPSVRELWTCWRDSYKGPQRRCRAGGSLLSGKAEWAGTVQPGEEQAQGNKYLKRGCKEDKTSSFQWPPVALPVGMDTKMKHRRLCQSIRKHLFTVRVTKCWHGLLSGVMVSPSLEILRSCLDMVIGGHAWEGGLDYMTSTGTFQPQPFCGSVMAIHVIVNWTINFCLYEEKYLKKPMFIKSANTVYLSQKLLLSSFLFSI